MIYIHIFKQKGWGTHENCEIGGEYIKIAWVCMNRATYGYMESIDVLENENTRKIREGFYIAINIKSISQASKQTKFG